MTYAFKKQKSISRRVIRYIMPFKRSEIIAELSFTLVATLTVQLRRFKKKWERQIYDLPFLTTYFK
jgi:hypothetical protein